MTHTGLLRTAPWRRFALLAVALSVAIVSCKKDATAPTIGSKLVFTVQPTNAIADSSIIPGIVVTIEDANGNTVTTSTEEVTLSLSATTNGAVLSGTAAVAAAGGVATFPYLSVSGPGTGYTLTASATGLPSATSAAFNIGQITTGPFTQLSAGGTSTCGVTTGGTAYCWGYNNNGQLGNGATTNAITPIKVIGGLTLASVGTAGLQFFSCGLSAAGAAYCWGYNDYGQLGDGNYTSSSQPAAVLGNLTFSTLTAGEDGHACGIAAAGAAYCWGYNGSGQLGVPSVAYSNSPVAVGGGLSFATISAGENGETCGVTTAGAGYCWGFNDDGELGNGTKTTVNAPTPVSGGLTFQSISAGFASTCGIAVGGSAYCWGDNTYGELGNGSTTSSTTPVEVGGGHSFASISVGDAFACGVTTGGALYCWGYNAEGQLGNGSAAQSSTPTAVAGGLTYASVSAGYATACALTTGGAAYCWGTNTYGQLGNQSVGSTLVPVLVVTPP